MKKLWLLALVAMLASLYTPAFADDSMEDANSAIGALTAKVDDLAKKGPSVEIHGFAQADFINTSTGSFAETVGDGKVVVPASGSVPNAGNNGNTQFSLRNSRIDLLGKENAADWAFKGYIEADFLGINNAGAPAGSVGSVGGNAYKYYTQPTFRLRHAYVEGDTTDGWQILAGQYWSLFGWDMDYVLSSVAEAPIMGTLYERIPQLKIQKTLGDNKGAELQVAVSAEKPDQDIDQIPNLNAGVRFIMNDVKGYFCSATGGAKLQPLSVGISERNANYAWADGNAKAVLDQSVWGSAVAADVLLPVLPAAEGKDDPSIVITGEYTVGAGDTMPFNGGGFGGLSVGSFSGPGGTFATTSTYTTELDGGEGVLQAGSGLQLIQLQSYNAQVMIALPRSIGTIVTVGYGELFASNAYTLGASFNDDSNWFANVMQDVSKNVRVAAEVSQYYTHYTTGTNPQDNRIQISTWYRF